VVVRAYDGENIAHSYSILIIAASSRNQPFTLIGGFY
jgi:hypothetical protein